MITFESRPHFLNPLHCVFLISDYLVIQFHVQSELVVGVSQKLLRRFACTWRLHVRVSRISTSRCLRPHHIDVHRGSAFAPPLEISSEFSQLEPRLSDLRPHPTHCISLNTDPRFGFQSIKGASPTNIHT